MKEFEKIELLLKTKAYQELNASERALVDQELTQETYEELHTSMAQLQGEQLKVGKDVKYALMQEFKQKQKTSFSFFQFKMPAYTHAVPLLVIVYLLFFVPREEMLVTQDRIVEVMVRDTVQVTQIDTLWIETVVKVPTPVYVTQDLQPDKKEEIQQVSNRSLSDQKDVLDLVVRGLD